MLFLPVTAGFVPLWAWLIPLGILVPEAVRDIKDKTIYLSPVILGSIAGLVVNLVLGNDIAKILAGCIPGAFLFLVSVITGECIGRGDGEVTAMIGLTIGLTETIWVLFIALMAAMFVCLILLLAKKAGRKSRIPFVPFLLFGTILRAGMVILC